jgi:hypothetical protein
MPIKDIHDWSKLTGLIPAGSHLQEAVDAIRELQRQISQFSSPEEFVPQERFLALITNGPDPDYNTNAQQNSGAGADWADYRYWVKRILIFGSPTNAAVAAGYDTIDEDVPAMGNTPGKVDVYTATNLPEMIVQTTNQAMHGLPTNETFCVEVFGWWDVGNPQTKHYFFSACPAVAWMQVTSPATGGGYYNGTLLTGPPQTLDPTVNLVTPINPYENLSVGENVIGQNILETNLNVPSGCVGSHWVQLPQVVEAWYVGMSKESTPRPTYRFSFLPRGPFKVTLSQVSGSNGDSTTSASWTYDVFQFGSSNKIGSSLPVSRPRIAHGPMSMATTGYAEYDSTGTLVLDEAWEVHGDSQCTAVPG